MSPQVPTSNPAPHPTGTEATSGGCVGFRAGHLAWRAQFSHRDGFVETREKTRLESEQREPVFPKMRIANEGAFLTPQGNYLHTVYVDLSGEVEAERLCLVKATEAVYDLATASTIRLSRPGVFRGKGEVLIQDEQEGRARTSQDETVEVPNEEPGLLGERVSALNAALKLSRTKMSVSGSKHHTESKTSSQAVTFGADWLIYCVSMRPSNDEEEAWRKAFPGSYTSFTTIYRPTQFAQGLGLGVCEDIGVRGKANPQRGTFGGFGTVEEQRRAQIVMHGPVLYVDTPYHCIEEAVQGWEKLSAMIFLKSRERDYAAQKEYRFALLSIGPEVGDVFDLPMSGMLKDCLSPVKYPEGKPEETAAAVSKDKSSKSEERPTGRTYTYKRRRTQSRRSSWNQEQPDSEGSEEVIEETVTSPEEVPKPFPSDEQRLPDVIMFHQVGTKFRFVHKAYRDEETQHWRVETLRQNPLLAEGTPIGTPPTGLTIPHELRYDTLDEHPIDPRYVLELCLNPSEPKPPMPVKGLTRCTPTELAHVLGCGQSLRMAVDLLNGTERARAAASAWFAQRFILDLVTRFGPIVHSVCIIRDSLAVVQLTRAPLARAVAWVVLSGTGTYLLNIDDGKVEEKVFPGGSSRAGRLGPEIYVDLLARYGWPRKRED